eukprot:1485762-Pleurochrysis_carterae.AAC.3
MRGRKQKREKDMESDRNSEREIGLSSMSASDSKPLAVALSPRRQNAEAGRVPSCPPASKSAIRRCGQKCANASLADAIDSTYPGDLAQRLRKARVQMGKYAQNAVRLMLCRLRSDV